jgi:hypothetical protein
MQAGFETMNWKSLGQVKTKESNDYLSIESKAVLFLDSPSFNRDPLPSAADMMALISASAK